MSKNKSPITFKEVFADELKETWLDDYSDSLKRVNSGLIYENSLNPSLISEGSFARLISNVNDNNIDSCIITAYRAGYTKQENIKRNRKLRFVLNLNKMGVYQLVGHFQETIQDSNEKVDVVERSYFVIRPSEQTFEQFKILIQTLMTIDSVTQDSVLIHHDDTWYLMDANGNFVVIGTHVALGCNRGL